MSKQNRNGGITEKGAIRKKWKGRLPVAVAFPENYATGMANLGLQVVYSMLNSHDFIVAERFFTSYNSNGHGNRAPRSIESGRRLNEFTVILFSVSFETSYINLVRMLHISGIPLERKQLAERKQLVLAGGVAPQINPEPAAPFVDGFLLGDFEEISEPFAMFLEQMLSDTTLVTHREHILYELIRTVPGVYIPSFYQPVHDLPDNRLVDWNVPSDLPFPVSSARFTGRLKNAPCTTVTSSGSAFPDMCAIELVRGCGRGCRFCAAGFIYRPPRHWSNNAVQRAIESCIAGSSRVGLVGLEYTSSENISKLCKTLTKADVSISFSSIRTDAVTDEFVNILKTSGTKTATIAPEAGSEKMRKIINKNLTEKQIIDGVTMLAEGGIPNLKLYFMTGLPEEEMSDVEAIAQLSDRIFETFLQAGKRRGQLGTVTVSVNTFIPKAWTPMQWAGLEKFSIQKEKRGLLKKNLGKRPNFRLKLESPDKALLQATLSRGDRRLAPVIAEMAINRTPFKKAMASAELTAEEFVRQRSEEECLPWEVVAHPVSSKYLLEEWHKAMNVKQTGFCKPDLCRRCGACE